MPLLTDDLSKCNLFHDMLTGLHFALPLTSSFHFSPRVEMESSVKADIYTDSYKVAMLFCDLLFNDHHYSQQRTDFSNRAARSKGIGHMRA